MKGSDPEVLRWCLLSPPSHLIAYLNPQAQGLFTLESESQAQTQVQGRSPLRGHKQVDMHAQLSLFSLVSVLASTLLPPETCETSAKARARRVHPKKKEVSIFLRQGLPRFTFLFHCTCVYTACISRVNQFQIESVYANTANKNQ